MDYIKEELCIKECVLGRSVKNHMQWGGGHVERLDEGLLPRMT